ncbi:hypothetical protein JCM13304A_15430 [Desulfothermus okinawensis JCM 13304]
MLFISSEEKGRFSFLREAFKASIELVDKNRLSTIWEYSCGRYLLYFGIEDGKKLEVLVRGILTFKGVLFRYRVLG